MNSKPIYVTQPSLAPLEEYMELLQEPWNSGILTHNGPLVRRFEEAMCEKLGIKRFVSVVNGTVALQMAIKALELKGEIITTPFSWVATVSAIKWEGCVPVFCDIDPETLNINPNGIEAHITEKTVAIMPVHVFGNPCDINSIQKIADKHGLKIIYDAAHSVGSTFEGKSLLEYGDITATSLHGTKIFNTAEGGACIAKNDELHEKLKRIRFFGHDEAKNVIEDGFNGKMTEIHAALGLANLKYFDRVLADRKEKYCYYKEKLILNRKLSFQKQSFGEGNFSYFPLILESEAVLLCVEKELNAQKIFPRRYFYPSLNTYNDIVDYVRMPISEDISKRIICLPLYYTLERDEMDLIVSVLRNI